MFRAIAVLAFSAFAQTADYQRGVALFEKGDAAAAVPYLTRAANADPKNAQKWKALGAVHAALKNYSEAEDALSRACKLDYRVPDACFFHARTLYALGRYEEALLSLSHADPHSWRARLARAEALEALGRASDAEREFREALTLAAGADARPAAEYGRFLIRNARAAEAIPLLRPTVAAHPASADAHLYLGRALFETGKLPEALPHLEKAATLAPTSAQAHLLLAKLYVRLGRSEEAETHFDLAKKYDAEK